MYNANKKEIPSSTIYLLQLQKISQTIERGQAIKEQLLASQSGLKNTTLGKNQILLKKRFNYIN